MKRLLSSTVIVLAATTAAQAQSGPSLQFSGAISLETLSFGGSGTSPLNYLFADLEADFAITTLSSGVDLGVVLDLKYLAGEFDNPSIIHGSLYADFGDHRITLGYPQGSYATFAGPSITDGIGLFNVGIAPAGTIPYADLMQGFFGKYSPGVRYDGEFGNLSVSGSYTRMTLPGLAINSAGLSVKYQFSDAISVWASSESIDTGGLGINNRYAVGALGSYGKLDYSVTYSESFFTGSSIDVHVGYQINDTFEVAFGVKGPTDDPTALAYGVSAKYGIGDRYFIRGTILTNPSSTTATTGFSAGIEF